MFRDRAEMVGTSNCSRDDLDDCFNEATCEALGQESVSYTVTGLEEFDTVELIAAFKRALPPA